MVQSGTHLKSCCTLCETVKKEIRLRISVGHTLRDCELYITHKANNLVWYIKTDHAHHLLMCVSTAERRNNHHK